MKIKVQRTEVNLFTMFIMILFGFALTASLASCSTWRGMGKDVKKVTNKTSNMVGNVLGTPRSNNNKN